LVPNADFVESTGALVALDPNVNIVGGGADEPPNNSGDNCFSAGGVDEGTESNFGLDGELWAEDGPKAKGVDFGASFASAGNPKTGFGASTVGAEGAAG